MHAERPPSATVSVALFASGSGSNVAALLEHRYTGAVRPRFCCLIGNNSGARVMALAREHSVPTYHVSRHTHPQRDACLARLAEILTRHRIELIVLAGYMKLLPMAIVRRWRGRILNIHPALLPRHGGRGMYGLAPHRAVLAAGERETGVTVHLVDGEYDGGPILMQRTVPVRAGDTAETLARRVLAVEHDTYWRAVEQVAAEVTSVRERAVSGRASAAPGVPRGRARAVSGTIAAVSGGRAHTRASEHLSNDRAVGHEPIRSASAGGAGAVGDARGRRAAPAGEVAAGGAAGIAVAGVVRAVRSVGAVAGGAAGLAGGTGDGAVAAGVADADTRASEHAGTRRHVRTGSAHSEALP